MTETKCSDCNHYYITYKAKFPYGCKAFGIISKNIPYFEIRKVSGIDCALFSKKKKNANIKTRGRLA